MKPLLTILLVFPLYVFAQEPLTTPMNHVDTSMYDWKGEVKQHMREGEWIGTETRFGEKAKGIFVHGQLNGTWAVYYKSGKLREEGQYANNLRDGIWIVFAGTGDTLLVCHYKMGVPDGLYKTFTSKNRCTREGSFVSGKKEGKWIATAYNYKSELMARTVYTYVGDVLNGPTIVTTFSGKKTYNYDAGNLISRDSIASIDSLFVNKPWPPLQEDPLMFAEEMPYFIGGESAFQQYLKENTVYPASAKANKKAGTCYITFIVEKDGAISDVYVRKGIKDAPELDAEAVRVIQSMPKWVPGQMNGRPVRVELTIPFRFEIGN